VSTRDLDARSSSTDTAPERIHELAQQFTKRISAAAEEIGTINSQVRILSFNAQIEAARVGDAGRAFRVVGEEMVTLAARTGEVAGRLKEEIQGDAQELAEISQTLATTVRGVRLADLALTNIDLVDRNLYERSCDIRWWATDSSVVAALETGSPQALRHATRRLGVILKAYTVYSDIVLADATGTIVANGRPAQYRSQGTNHASAEWMRSAMATANGDEFGFESAHRSPLAGGEPVLVYSCKVCRGGDPAGEPIGVLGTVFNWTGLGEKVVRDTPLEGAEKARTRCCLIDREGRLLADSDGKALTETLDLGPLQALLTQPKGFAVLDYKGERVLCAHAQSPGFETYATGWHSLIMQKVGR
jgi:hypothetical protein